MLSHAVYFTLKDSCQEAQQALIAACEKYLRNHEGVLYFSAGVLEPELAREVNDRAFDVALLVVFKDRAAHDAYQAADAHLRFIEEGRDNWARVRVFDSISA